VALCEWPLTGYEMASIVLQEVGEKFVNRVDQLLSWVTCGEKSQAVLLLLRLRVELASKEGMCSQKIAQVS